MESVKSPFISVIAAVYNGEEYLRLAMESVLNQSFKDIEFVIVDDCSTDQTPAIIASYRDSRIVYIRNPMNLGQTPSLNVALNAAKGKYIARMDADDIYLPGKLEKQYAFMEEHPDIAVSGTAGIKIDEEGNEISVYSPPSSFRDAYFNIFFRSPLIHVSVICRRSALVEMGGYDEKYPFRADFALWSKLVINHYKITSIKDKLIKYRELTCSPSHPQKLFSLGQETAEILYSNISTLLDIPFTKQECKEIVFMLIPSSGIGVQALAGVYLNLRKIAKKAYSGYIPPRISLMLTSMLFWSVAKRCVYLKSQGQALFFFRDFYTVSKYFFKDPAVPVLYVGANVVGLAEDHNLFLIKKYMAKYVFKIFYRKKAG